MKNEILSPVEVINLYFESLKSGDLQTLGNLMADDLIWHQPGKGKLSKTYQGKAEVFALFGKFMEISQGSFKIDHVTSIMANGSSVVATLQFSAGHERGKILMKGVDLMKIENGKIREVTLFSENQDLEDSFWDKR